MNYYFKKRFVFIWLLTSATIFSQSALAQTDARPSLEDLVDEALILMNAAGNGVERARLWFDTFEGSFRVDPASLTEQVEPPVKEPRPIFEVPDSFRHPAGRAAGI